MEKTCATKKVKKMDEVLCKCDKVFMDGTCKITKFTEQGVIILDLPCWLCPKLRIVLGENMSLWKKIKKILRQLAGKDLPKSVIE